MLSAIENDEKWDLTISYLVNFTLSFSLLAESRPLLDNDLDNDKSHVAIHCFRPIFVRSSVHLVGGLLSLCFPARVATRETGTLFYLISVYLRTFLFLICLAEKLRA